MAVLALSSCSEDNHVSLSLQDGGLDYNLAGPSDTRWVNSAPAVVEGGGGDPDFDQGESDSVEWDGDWSESSDTGEDALQILTSYSRVNLGFPSHQDIVILDSADNPISSSSDGRLSFDIPSGEYRFTISTEDGERDIFLFARTTIVTVDRINLFNTTTFVNASQADDYPLSLGEMVELEEFESHQLDGRRQIWRGAFLNPLESADFRLKTTGCKTLWMFISDELTEYDAPDMVEFFLLSGSRAGILFEPDEYEDPPTLILESVLKAD